MYFMHRGFMLGFCAALFFFPVATHADSAPTAQGAHDFFSLLASKHLLRSGDMRYAKNYQNSGDCTSSWDDSKEGAPELSRHIVVDWSSITSAVNMKGSGGDNDDSVVFSGAIVFETTRGTSIRRSVQLFGSDGVTRDRIFKAGELLRTHCDTLSATGF